MADNLNQNEEKSVHYSHLHIGEIVDPILKIILKKSYGRSDHVDAKIEAAWREHYGTEFTPAPARGELPFPLLHGSSGIAKSKIVQALGRRIAEMLDMELVINPKGRTEFSENEVVVCDVNFKSSGDLPFLLTGMVSINDVETDKGTKSYTTVVPNDKIYSVSENAGAGVRILFVDEVNSGNVAAEAFMALNDNAVGGDIDVGDTFMIGAGNLGEDDGNAATPNPVSVSTRAWNIMTKPDFDYWRENFIEPTYLTRPEGDYGVSVFLQMNRDYFDEKPPKASDIEGTSTVYGNPRTWSQAISNLDAVYGTSSELAKAGIERVANSVRGIVGKAGKDYAQFAYNLWTGVVPMVNDYMRKEGPSGETMNEFEARQGTGVGAESKDFIYQWQYQTSLTAANLIVSELHKNGLSDGFGLGTEKMNESLHKKAQEVFGDIGYRFGRTISGLKSNGLQNVGVSEFVNQMQRITVRQMPWLNQKGRIIGSLRKELYVGVLEALKKHNADPEHIKNVSAIMTNDTSSKPSMKKRSNMKPL